MKLLGYEQFFPDLFVSVQWCGNHEALSNQFFETLPHEVDFVFGITPVIGEIVTDKN